ncbi:MAG: GIY-YIG nuclease family protein [Candidatus Pacebacteria bacterium]|nr:GIY-YIG nuclease family protein [Candidatus Paceibacterota bacterium]
MRKDEFKKYKLPEISGVYFFLDKKNKSKNNIPKKEDILYIGKATILKDRISSYFNNDLINSRGIKIQSMIENTKDIFFLKTNSVLEAIILESKYIKEFQPFFNTKEKDDKSHSFVVFTKEDFPRVLVIRGRDIIDNKILKSFGPFVSKMELVEIMKIIRKIFPFRDKCDLPPKPIKGREFLNINLKPCFNYQIGLCPGSCIGKISEKDYKKNLDAIEKILNSENVKLTEDLEKEMKKFAKINAFEKAKEARDKIFSLNHLREISLIKNNNLENENGEHFRIEAYDVAHISGTSRVGVMIVLEGGEFKKEDYKKFKLQEFINNDLLGLKEILERRFKHKEWKYPNLIVVDGGKTHLKFAKNILKNILSKKDSQEIKVLSVVKNDRHKAREILFDSAVEKLEKERYNKSIILANNEAHRFAISYHKLLRNKIKRV